MKSPRRYAAGWEVFEAASVECAMSLLAQYDFSVITDIQLQGSLSGWDLAEACRASHPHVGVIYTSGNSADRSRSVEGSLFFGKLTKLLMSLRHAPHPCSNCKRIVPVVHPGASNNRATETM